MLTLSVPSNSAKALLFPYFELEKNYSIACGIYEYREYMYIFDTCILNMMASMEDPEGSYSGSLPMSSTLSPVLFSSVFFFFKI